MEHLTIVYLPTHGLWAEMDQIANPIQEGLGGGRGRVTVKV